MAKPVFVMQLPGFLVSTPNPRTADYAGEKTLFGPVKRFYVHGSLMRKVGYDVVNFVAGDFLDLPLQEATLIDDRGTEHEAVIVMVTSTKGNKYAFLVENTYQEIEKARACLWSGEWLRDGTEIYNYL